MYVLAEFLPSNTLSAIPEGWLINDEQCYWPLKDATKCVREQLPKNDRWLQCTIRLFRRGDNTLRKYASYEIANKKITELLDKSDLSSTESEEFTEVSRTRQKSIAVPPPPKPVVANTFFSVNPLYSLSAHEHSDPVSLDSDPFSNYHSPSSSSNIPSPSHNIPPYPASTTNGSQNCTPPSAFHIRTTNNENTVNPSLYPTASHPCSTSISNINLFSSSAPQIPTHSMSTTPKRSSKNQIQRDLPHSPSLVTVTPNSPNISNTSTIQDSEQNPTNFELLQAIKNLTKVVVRMENRIGALEDYIRNNPTAAGAPDTDTDSLPKLPATTAAEIMAIEQFLAVPINTQSLIKHLCCVGGETVEVSTKLVLLKLFTNDGARLLLWTGANGKLEMQKMQIIKIIFGVVRKLHPVATEASVINFIKKWVRRAGDRIRSKNKSQKSK